ncbi:hypothetical protein BU26DRAFT_119050 [Trematosphaeria pertusa]|uniref:Uncharacterized protein n=1 Tax=Trematosphaeria pertusa TaxID=390896 RepID=A0A6A6I0L5_9PLEO|nr:uncharacterized protein BU26DRAFT_119050 [Trematosphaeria pertusa]KAF2243522.1 hypothetical protein BU26DRAFT_119050 [Trematosphaeria pertusa]
MRTRDIIAVSVVLGFSFLSAMVLVARFLWVHKSTKDQSDTPSEYSVDAVPPHNSLLSRDRALLRLFTPKRNRGQWVPTLSGIIKAGDEGVYSSALFDGLHSHLGRLPLETLYDAFANELRRRPMAERSSYPSEISKFLAATRHPQRRRSLRTGKLGRPELPPRPQRNSIDLAEMGLNRARSRRTSPVLISTFNSLPSESENQTPVHELWADGLQHAQYFEGRTGITVTAAELSALSIILGSALQIELFQDLKDNEKPEHRSSLGKGAFGISISGAPTDDGNYHISLTQHKRSVSQLPARGSGYSTLHAKHLASGFLPFSQDRKTVSSILITNATLETLRSGTCLHLQKNTPQTPGSRFLTTLPNSKEPNFHVLSPAPASTSTPPLLHAIAALPFTGGLAPLATTPLINTVRFVASGGLPPGRLLQRLEALVDKVHRQAPSLQLFGALLEDSNAGILFRERERLGKLAAGGSINEALADKVARMHRYTTLLERLTCLVPDMKPHDALAAVREATKQQIERAYEDAVAAYSLQKDTESWSTTSTTTPDSKRLSRASNRGSVRRSNKRSSTSSDNITPSTPASPASLTSPRPSSTFARPSLGTLVEQVLKASLPLDVETVALVARMVLVAWTFSVDGVAWEKDEEGWRVPDLGNTGLEKMYMW